MGAIRDRVMGNYRGVVVIESSQAPDSSGDAIITDKRLDSDPTKTAGQKSTLSSVRDTENPGSDTTTDWYNVALSSIDSVWP